MPESSAGVRSFGAAPVFKRHELLGRWTPLPVPMTGAFLIVLDFLAVNVALPSIQRQLGACSSAIEWVVAGYARICSRSESKRMNGEFGPPKQSLSPLPCAPPPTSSTPYPKPPPL